MPTGPYEVFSSQYLLPALASEKNVEDATRIAASQSIAIGTVLGEVGSTGVFKAYSGADIAAPAAGPAGTPDVLAGTIPDGVYTLMETYTNGTGETTPSPATTATVTGGPGEIVVAAETLPAGATGRKLYMSEAAGSDTLRLVSTVAGGIAHTVTALPVANAAQPPAVNTATAATDGSQHAKRIAKYACSTDSSGNLTVMGEWAQFFASVPAYIGGYFRIEDLVGFDAGAAEDLKVKVLQGAIGGTGLIEF